MTFLYTYQPKTGKSAISLATYVCLYVNKPFLIEL